MKKRNIQLSLTALLVTVAIGAGPACVARAQTHASEFPAPQAAAQDDHAAASDKPAGPVAGGGTMGPARALPFDQMQVHPAASGGESRTIAHGTLATGESVNLHQSMQVVGQAPPALHVIHHSEFILVREGEVEFQHEVDGKIVSERVGPGGVLYVAYGTRHVVKNVGSVPARYFVVAIGGDAK